MILNNTIKDWLIAVSIIIAALILLRLFQAVVVNRLKTFSARTNTSIDDFATTVLQASVMPLLYILAINFGLKYLVFSTRATEIIHVALMFVVTFFILRIITSAISYGFKQALVGKGKTELREKQAKVSC